MSILVPVNVSLQFCPLHRAHALAILSWRYPPPYDVYNLAPDDLADLLNPQNAFFALMQPDNTLAGFCSFGPDGQVSGGRYDATALDVGMGLHPDLIGQGQGQYYATAVVQYGRTRFGARHFRITIATFNLRAQRLWQRLGFEPVEQFCRTGSHQTFVIMVGAIAG